MFTTGGIKWRISAAQALRTFGRAAQHRVPVELRVEMQSTKEPLRWGNPMLGRFPTPGAAPLDEIVGAAVARTSGSPPPRPIGGSDGQEETKEE